MNEISKADPRSDLKSCFYSFIPLILSIPFLFTYHLGRVSLWMTYAFVLPVFLIHFFVFRRFYSQAVFIRAHLLTLLLTIGLIWTATSPAVGLYTSVVSIFHVSEYISVGLWSPKTLELRSFLLDHSRAYHAALTLGYIEYFVKEYYFFSNGVPLRSLWIFLGLIMVIFGELLRKLAMRTARQSFSHIIEDKPNQGHRLITHGVYGYCRHPSYVGWFLWACGTQVLLANPVSLIIYSILSWIFFSDRISYEEETLITHYGELYRSYQKRVPTGIPFIRGFTKLHR